MENSKPKSENGMDCGASDRPSAQSSHHAAAESNPEATARTVLAHHRKLLNGYEPGMPVERTLRTETLSTELSNAALERERLFMRGWLHWLNDDPAGAVTFFTEALQLPREPNLGEGFAEVTYWYSRVRLLLGHSEALAEYELALRSLGGSPRAAAWLVDLLGRAGRVDRAEQVWKTLRNNRRVAECAESPLLEARMLLHHGDLAAAERLLCDAKPASGVVWVEQRLLLAWIAASQKQADKARELLRQAGEGPYPAAALRDWAAKVERRLGGEGSRETKQGQEPLRVPVVPWCLHQAARASVHEDAEAALGYIRNALSVDPELAGVANAHLVREAIPLLQHRVRALRLARALQPEGESLVVAPAVLNDAVTALGELPDAEMVLDLLENGCAAAIRAHLEKLIDQRDLSPRLAHHLALLTLRAARAWEDRGDSARAESCWRRSWLCWLRFMATNSQPLLLDYLLRQHRHRLQDLLACNAVDAAARHWRLVRELPARAAEVHPALGRGLAERVKQFREELATEYLLTTRETMRFGVVPEGWRADYENGLSNLRRLLSLDRGNVRLLTALVEICNDWFLDLYHQNDGTMLRRQLKRFTPFALQLARLIEDDPGHLPARAALSDYWKFRGFVAAERDQKVTLYREALHFNPANTNVRDLLEQISPEEGRP